VKKSKPGKLRFPSSVYFKLGKIMQRMLLKKTLNDDNLSIDCKYWISREWIARK
jgi:hypothetical protein